MPVHVFPRDGLRARHITKQMAYHPIHPDYERVSNGKVLLPKIVHKFISKDQA